MRYIKPYGRLVHKNDNDDKNENEKVIITRGNGEKTPQALVNKEINIALSQRISILDKIIKKPSNTEKISQFGYGLRDFIGKILWENIIKSYGYDKLKLAELQYQWQRKLHPYGKAQNDVKNYVYKGRWFDDFLWKDGEKSDLKNIEKLGKFIASQIEAHINENERRMGWKGKAYFNEFPAKEVQARKHGKLANIIKSIENNGLKPIKNIQIWGETHENTYKNGDDLAKNIYKTVKISEKNPLSQVGEILYQHYANLFKDENNEPLKISVAKEIYPELFALHEAVKLAYRDLLKNRKVKGTSKNDKKVKNIEEYLPQNFYGLMKLITARQKNRDVNHHIRMGKIIHYTASKKGTSAMAEKSYDAVFNIAPNWPSDDEINASDYWKSFGQEEIKRNEAFVRTWRGLLTMASCSLTHWADPAAKNIKQDILVFSGKKSAIENFDAKIFDAGLRLRFGESLFSKVFTSDDAKKDFLKFIIECLTNLRNNSFHFKGRENFAQAIQSALENSTLTLSDEKPLTDFYEADLKHRGERLKADLKSIGIEHFLDKDQAEKLCSNLCQTGEEGGEILPLPLPRFNRITKRLANISDHNLIKPVNKSDMENPAIRCQYGLIKKLYERRFRYWLAADQGDINGWIKAAISRNTEVAKTLNKKEKFVRSKAEKLIEEQNFSTVQEFLQLLFSQTAVELSVTKGYQSDGDAAQEQAKYILDLQHDVMARGFLEFIKTHQYEFLLKLHNVSESAEPKFDLENLPVAPSKEISAIKDWQKKLYLLLHLVPVSHVGRLQHQMYKLAILEDKGKTKRDKIIAPLLDTMMLYQDMHDARFQGSEVQSNLVDMKKTAENWFSEKEDIDKIFQQSDSHQRDQEQEAAHRGLREMERFGTLKHLNKLFLRNDLKIEHSDVVDLLVLEKMEGEIESKISKAQEILTRLHAGWVDALEKDKKENKGGEGSNVKDYLNKHQNAYHSALRTKTNHQNLTHDCRLQNHLKCQQILMQILGRLADYAGLFERDLYFITLSLIHEDENYKSLLKVKEFQNGQVITALKKQKNNHALLKRIMEIMASKKMQANNKNNTKLNEPGDFLEIKTRNSLAHFNILRGDKGIDLNLLINQTRRMMAYDRKMKNAVTKSIKAIFTRENMEAQFKYNKGKYELKKIVSNKANHMGKKEITEDLCSKKLLAMIGALFQCGSTNNRNNHSGGKKNSRPHQKRRGN